MKSKKKDHRYGAFGHAMEIVVDQQMLNGDWNRHTTEFLMKRILKLGKIPEDLAYGRSKEFGELNQFALPELLLMRLRTRRMRVSLPPSPEYPNGRAIRVRALHNVPSGKPLDLKRAEDPDAYAKTGLWVRTVDMTVEEADQVDQYYRRRRQSARADAIMVAAIKKVLDTKPVDTTALDCWDEILLEIAKTLLAG